ncbi:MAG TPA: T9SS type A sorting domain-containing protein [candidate division WOR-3 bacterium]|uniref:T9SS type A sorting domain-containing protein n=1 Tax=candidate division WOR-3 bacterium TaxID=2052148 RepID=A0A7V0XFK5_UNCW3|nr:T9SS type A sorting domain-containing protein [candidate division WOR-3 bacterium]
MTLTRLLAWPLLMAAVATAGFYDDDRVNRVELRFAERNWREILDSLYARGEGERLVGEAVINGVRFDSVGVRFKGNSSYHPSRRKNPFNIDLNYLIPGQRIDGHGTLKLANVFKDPSFVREVLSYEIARRYMPAGRANYANVHVNDTLIGLYTNVEDVDKRFLRERFYSDGNARFKGELTDTTRPAGWRYYGSDTAAYGLYYRLMSDSGWRELIGFLDTLNNHPAATEELLNVDRHLWFLAFHIVMVNLDAPVNMPQNYYLYRDDSDRFNPVIWDLNENFGAFRDLLGSGQLSLAQMQQLDPFLRGADPNYPIASRIFPNPRWRRAYVAHARTMLEECFACGWYEDRALELQDVIDADVRADPNKFYSYNDFHNNVNRSVGSGPLAIVGLTELMQARTSFLLSRPEFRASPPVIAAPACEPARPAPGTEVRFTVRVENADSVFLGWRRHPTGRFHRLAMAASDRSDAYAVTLRPGAGELHYFIYAENAEAAAFLPARAEHEFFTLPVGGDMVINELMALNETTVRDPYGEYDDWVELHNTSDTPVALGGWYLSDDSTRPTRWTFPDTTIPGRGYLVVWADGQPEQGPLHAGFSLAGSGEMVLLSRPDRTAADRVIFGQQNPDISFGRWPNGTGGFRFMNPTFGAENDSAVGLAERPGATVRLPLSAFPNPFAGTTTIHYELASPATVSLRVYDAGGRLVATLVEGDRGPGRHQARFAPGDPVPRGVYFVQLSARAGRDAGTGTVKLVMSR